jgi:hypothetical protein
MKKTYSKWPRRRVATLTAVPALLLALAVSGCGDDGPGSKPSAATTTNPAEPADLALKFVRCMRENGVPMDDPEPGGGIRLRVKEGDGSASKVEAAQKACKKLDPGQAAARARSPEDLDRDVKVAQCLRARGIDVDIPSAGQPMRVRGKRGGEKAMDDAMQACQGPRSGPKPPSGQG